jgi:DNA-binding transcriptional LysR family regulator
LIQATLHQLIVFEAAARHQSFTRAAEELSITQPTVSTQIKQLTQGIGIPLFEQIGKRLYLTETGKHLFSTCEYIFERLENFDMVIAALQGTKQGKLRLLSVTTAQYFIPRILGRFCQKYPGVDISLEVTNHQQLLERMKDNHDDLYILSYPLEDLTVVSQRFLENPLVAIAPKAHPLAQEKNIPIQRLEQEPFIMREAGSGTRRAVEQLFHQHGVNVPVRLEIGNNEAIKQAIAGGLGISVLSRHVFNQQKFGEEFAILDVQHFPIKRYWYVSYPKGKQLSIIAQTFLDYLLIEVQNSQNPSSNFLIPA